MSQVGIWIDHRKAVIVTLNGKEESLVQIESGVEKHTRAAGGSRSSSPTGPQDVIAEDKTEHRFMQHLNKFYKDVIHHVQAAEQILILGPGEAKIEFQKQFKTKELASRIVAVETSDKLTDKQLAAKVREYFQAKPVA